MCSGTALLPVISYIVSLTYIFFKPQGLWLVVSEVLFSSVSVMQIRRINLADNEGSTAILMMTF